MRWKSNKARWAMLWLLLVLAYPSCKSKHDDHRPETVSPEQGAYSCPMRCEGDKTYPEPGNCPVCHMKLQLAEGKLEQTASPAKLVLSRQATFKVRDSVELYTIKVHGYIDYDRNKTGNVATRFGGRIEKIFVKYNMQQVKKGDKILELYSPEMNTIMEQHLLLMNTDGEKTLIEKSREKMKLLGLFAEQISELEFRGVVSPVITVYSPANGFVLFDSGSRQTMAVASAEQSPMGGMGSDAAEVVTPNAGASGRQIREGMYVNSGEVLFGINDLQTVWAILSIPPEYRQTVDAGKPIRLMSELFPGKVLEGKVLLTEQTFEDRRQRFIRVRVSLPNPNTALKINSLVTAELTIASSSGFDIPASAVYMTGLNAYVWVRTGTTKRGSGIFELRKVTAGARQNNSITVLNGLKPGEEVAMHAGAMTDSETFLNGN